MNSKTRILAVALGCLLLAAATTGLVAGEPRDAASAMRTKVPTAALGSTLGEALTQLEKIAGIKFEPDWLVLGDLGLGKDTKASLDATDSTIGQLLDSLLQKVAPKGRTLAWYILDNKVQVTTQTRALTKMRSKPAADDDDLPAAHPAKTSARTSARRGSGSSGTTLNFDEVPLSDVVEFFRSASGLNIHVNWKALELASVTKETTITLQANNISLGRALTLMTDQLNAGKARDDSVFWVVDDGLVIISTGAALNQKLVTKTFDVADLLVYAPEFKGPRINFNVSNNGTNSQGGVGSANSMSNGGGGGGNGDNSMFPNQDQDRDGKDKDRVEQRKALRDSLISTIKESIGDDMWQPTGKGSVKMLGTRMVVSQTLLGFKLLEDTGTLK